MALYEITLEQSYFGQQIINRWNYQSAAIPEGQSGAFLAVVGMGFIEDDNTPAFDDTTIAGLMSAYQAASVTFVSVIAKNIYSVTDFYTYAFPPGTIGQNVAGEAMTPVAAYGFSSDRTRSDIRRAQKRFVGVTEGTVGAGGIILTETQGNLQNLGNRMGLINTATFESVTTTFTPYVFGREKYHPEGKTTWAYKYYETEAEQLEHIARINKFTVKPSVRTQNSRQYGRGA